MSHPGPTEPNLLDRRILRVVASSRLFELTLRGHGLAAAQAKAPEGADDTRSTLLAGAAALNRNPARLFAAIDGDDDPSFIESHAALFAEHDHAPVAALAAARCADLVAADFNDFTVIAARVLDLSDYARLGRLVEPELEAGKPLSVTSAGDIHPALSPSKWVFIALGATGEERLAPLKSMLKSIGSSDFDPIELQYDLFRMKAKLREEKARVDAMLEAKRLEIVQLEADRDIQVGKVEKLWNERFRRFETEREERFKLTEAELKARYEHLEAAEITERERLVAEQAGVVADYENRLRALEADRDARLSQSENEWRDRLNRLEAQSAETIERLERERDERIHQLERELKGRVEQLENDRDIRIAQLEGEKQHRDARIRVLETELAEIRRLRDSAERALGETLNSRSWRMTAPLRSMMNLMRGE